MWVGGEVVSEVLSSSLNLRERQAVHVLLVKEVHSEMESVHIYWMKTEQR
jgi:hypothetical protein